MALIRIKQYIENDVWKLQFISVPEELSEDDKNRMKKYGEPEINVGGVFLPSTANTFTLPVQNIKVKSGLPYTASFDSKSPDFEDNTQTKVIAYRDAILDRFDEAFEDLRTTTDTFTGEVSHNI